MTNYLSFEDVLQLAHDAVEPAQLLIRDPGLLQSAAHRPSATVFGQDAYPGLPRKAAALMESLARNHALVDGNKRLTWLATVVFLLLNDMELCAPSVDEGEAFVLAVAAGELELDEIEVTITGWLRYVEIRSPQD